MSHRGGGATHHSLVSYRARLKAFTQDVAARTQPAPLNVHASSHSLFVPRPGLGESPLQSPGKNARARGDSGPSQEFLDELGGLVGKAGSLLLSQAAQSGWTAAGARSVGALPLGLLLISLLTWKAASLGINGGDMFMSWLANVAYITVSVNSMQCR